MLMQKDICCYNFVGLIKYLRREYGESAVQTVIGDLIDNPQYQVAEKDNPSNIVTIREEHLTDPAYWVSNACSMHLLSNVKKVVSGENPLFDVAQRVVIEQLSRNVLFFARLFSLGFLAKQSTKINSRFNRTKEARFNDSKPNHILFELHYRPGIKVTKDVCNWNLGIYAGIARIAGARNLNIRETGCVIDGAHCCTFELAWKNVSPFKRLVRWMARYWVKDLIDEYEATVNERDLLIERLTQSEKRHRVLTENSLTGIFIIQNKNIVFANERFSEIFQKTPNEIVGDNFWYIIHPEDRPLIREKTRLSPDGTLRPTNLELRVKRFDGSLVWAHVLVTGILHNGSPAVMGNAIDITARKNAEEERIRLKSQLQQAQKMEAIGTLAGGIAHDFNNILAAIMGSAELANMDLPPNIGVEKYINQILKASHRAEDLVRQILAFSRVSEHDKKPVDLRHVVDEALKLLRATLPANIEIQQDADPDNATILADSTQIHQVLMNLCTNAAHAMEKDGGLLKLSICNTFIDSGNNKEFEDLKSGRYVRLTVADNGCGIEGHVAERIFDPYFTTKKRGKGTGLGLSVVHGIVMNHKGDIRMHSVPGQGTTFDLVFPVHETKMAESVTPERLPPRGHGNILLVDDEPQLVDIGKAMLERLGYKVSSRTEATAALNEFRTRPHAYDLVITDMNMPVMTGDKLARQLIEIRPDIPIILCTGFSEQITMQKAKSIGIREMLFKPVAIATYSKAINRTLPHS